MILIERGALGGGGGGCDSACALLRSALAAQELFDVEPVVLHGVFNDSPASALQGVRGGGAQTHAAHLHYLSLAVISALRSTSSCTTAR